MTWQATCGNGPATGIGRIILNNLQRASTSQSTRKGLKRRSIPPSRKEKKRVQKGGSYLCTDQYCTRYMVGTRGKGEVNTGTNHLGFRCVMTVEKSQLSASNDKP